MPFPGTPLQVPDFNKQEVEGIAVDAVKKEIASGGIATGVKLYKHVVRTFNNNVNGFYVDNEATVPNTYSSLSNRLSGYTGNVIIQNIYSYGGGPGTVFGTVKISYNADTPAGSLVASSGASFGDLIFDTTEL